MKVQKLSGNQSEENGQELLQFWLGSRWHTNTIQNVAVELFRKPAFHVLYIIHVRIDLDAYPGKLQSKNMSFMSKEG